MRLDSEQNGNSATVYITVVDQAPGAGNATYSIQAGTTLDESHGGLSSFAGDPDLQDTLTYQVVIAPAHGTLTQFNSDGTFIYQPQASYVGTDSFTYRVSDGAMFSPTNGTVNISINDAAPIAVADSYDVLFNTTLTTSASNGMLANDYSPSGNPLTAVQDTAPLHASSFTLNSDGTFSYTPTTGYAGADSFTYHVTDNFLVSSTVTVALSIDNKLVANNDVYYLDANGNVTIPKATGVLANDIDPLGGTPTASITGSGLSGLTLNSDGSLSYSPTVAPSALQTFTYQMVLGAVTSNIATVTLVPEAAAPKVSLASVSYSGTGVIAVYPDKDPKKDNPVPYPTAWDAKTNKVNPFIIVSGSKFNVTAKFTVDNPTLLGPLGKLSIIATGSFSLTVSTTITPELSLNGSTLTAQWNNTPALVLPTNDDDAVPVFDLRPSNADSSNQIVASGTPAFRVYVTYKKPTTQVTLRETFVRLGTIAAAGLSNDDDVIQAVITKFKTLNIHKVDPTGKNLDDGPLLQYYGSWLANANKWYSPDMLLRYNDGNCAAWVGLFLATIRTQGINAPADKTDASWRLYIKPKAKIGNSMFVKNWQITGGSNSTRAGYDYWNKYSGANPYDLRNAKYTWTNPAPVSKGI